ncbi:MAG: GyrI-like domain-containing protein [Chloroflexi bacterium]|nr:GyrI-like domain-containing protein [Chloroflexota bacterium]MYB21578.1 GyrI-like domain-containing protein [Chloroflexota bacterium]MYF21764.1 GyrI-like domain-containing protein [Chloroflexota bacterium]MYF81071.1 GyrI-like domain-containing protein [Chloroflexota bacterium]MYI03619.1 GyrI-like domain-containing protein [Chloroflexota bacterium]
MPEVVQLSNRRAAVMHAEASTDELPSTFERLFPAVFAALTEQGVSEMGHVTAVYHTMDANQMSLSAGIEIGDDVEPAEPLQLLELPACEAIKAEHYGPYDQLHQTHELVMGHLQEIGRTPAGGPIERYITDPEAEPDPSKWLTEIYLPLE